MGKKEKRAFEKRFYPLFGLGGFLSSKEIRVSKTSKLCKHAWEKCCTFWENFGLKHKMCCKMLHFFENLEKNSSDSDKFQTIL